MSDEQTWQADVLDALEHIIGAEQTARLAAEWEEHARREAVEVTVLGPYSSGKSSLLRRLIVDGGGQVPEWLTVSGRRETFELNSVDAGDLTFTDAPGFAAGNEGHDQLAHDALALSDAFLLVVPPQLLTTDRDFVGSVLSGSYFYGQPDGGVDSVTIAVIAQADTMGVDPDDDLDDLRQLGERKRSELRAQLDEAAGIALDALDVVCVAADPYGRQARQAQPDRSAFDPYRPWDSIDHLNDLLAALPGRSDELRQAARVRYFCRVGGAVAADADEVVGEMIAAADELRARRTAWSGHKARVVGVLDSARRDLELMLVGLAAEIDGELGGDRPNARAEIDQRMATAIERWAQRWDGELDLVLGEVGIEIDDRLSRSRAEHTEAFLRSLSNPVAITDASAAPNSRVVHLLNDIRGELHTIARKAFELSTSEPVATLIEKRRSAKSASDAAAHVANAADDSAKLAKRAAALEASLQLADAVIAVVTTIEAEQRQQQLDEQRRRDRAEAQEQIARSAATAANEIVNGTGGEPGWRVRADTTLDLLHEQLGLTGVDVDELVAQATAQGDAVANLRALLGHRPPRLAQGDTAG